MVRKEISTLKLLGLTKRAIAAGVDSDALEMALDVGDKSAIIELIVQTIRQVRTRALCELRAFAEAHSGTVHRDFLPPRLLSTVFTSSSCYVPPTLSASLAEVCNKYFVMPCTVCYE